MSNAWRADGSTVDRNSTHFGVRGKGIASRMFPMPVTKSTKRTGQDRSPCYPARQRTTWSATEVPL